MSALEQEQADKIRAWMGLVSGALAESTKASSAADYYLKTGPDYYGIESAVQVLEESSVCLQDAIRYLRPIQRMLDGNDNPHDQ